MKDEMQTYSGGGCLFPIVFIVLLIWQGAQAVWAWIGDNPALTALIVVGLVGVGFLRRLLTPSPRHWSETGIREEN